MDGSSRTWPWSAWIPLNRKNERWRFQKDQLGEYELRLKLRQHEKAWKRTSKLKALTAHIKRFKPDDEGPGALDECRALDYDTEDTDDHDDVCRSCDSVPRYEYMLIAPTVQPSMWRHRLLNARSSFGFVVQRPICVDRIAVARLRVAAITHRTLLKTSWKSWLKYAGQCSACRMCGVPRAATELHSYSTNGKTRRGSSIRSRRRTSSSSSSTFRSSGDGVFAPKPRSALGASGAFVAARVSCAAMSSAPTSALPCTSFS